MPDSRANVILDLAVAALLAASYTVNGVTHTRPAGLKVERYRLTALEPDELPAVGVYAQSEKSGRVAVNPPIHDRRLTFTVEARAAGDQGDKTTDPLTVWARVALFNNAAFLAALRSDALEEVGMEWDQDRDSDGRRTDVMAARLIFAADYRTRYGDPSQAG